MSNHKIEALIERATAAAVSATRAADAIHTLGLTDGQSRKDTPVVYLGDVVYILRAELPALLEDEYEQGFEAGFNHRHNGGYLARDGDTGKSILPPRTPRGHRR